MLMNSVLYVSISVYRFELRMINAWLNQPIATYIDYQIVYDSLHSFAYLFAYLSYA